MKEAFECKCEGELTEFVGNKVDVTHKPDGLKSIKFTQPVLIQKLEDEFELDLDKGPLPMIPAWLVKCW